ncbi:hypothetical protein BCE02nite_35630 [Brevibacillus centrosporus]|nr:hypothetical protein BCE02nite_35630 [Brevibacillus centrosporus]
MTKVMCITTEGGLVHVFYYLTDIITMSFQVNPLLTIDTFIIIGVSLVRQFSRRRHATVL